MISKDNSSILVDYEKNSISAICGDGREGGISHSVMSDSLQFHGL